MVFPGRFSTGCLRCRQRKVKCDEAKPTCRRCYIYGKPCLGYTDQFHFRHTLSNPRSETASSTSTSPHAPTTKAESSSPERIEYHQAPQEVPGDEQAERDEARCQAIVRHPGLSYDHVSLCYFVRRFVSPDEEDGFPGHLSFLPSLYNHHNHGVLEIATLSVAQMATYNQFGCSQLRMQSFKNCGRAIRMLQECIQSDDQAMDDRVITTILLLCTHKDISGEGLGDPNEHAPGLFYLLEKRGPGQIGTRRGAELFLLAHLRLQIYSFLHEDDTYSDPGAIATVMGLFNPLLRALSMMSRSLSLRHRLGRCMRLETLQDQADDASPTSLENEEQEEEQAIIQECFEMLDSFDTWDKEAAAYWQITFEGRAVPTALGEVFSDKTYYDAETACIIILVRSARLILLLTMLLYHSKLRVAHDEEQMTLDCNDLWVECISVLKRDVGKTIDDILSSVPYALGDVDPSGAPASMPHDGAGAIIIVHSIRLVSRCPYATSDQAEKAGNILARINSTIGIRSAVGWMPGESYELKCVPELDCPRQQVLENGTSSHLIGQALDSVQGSFECLS
ncbi:hypothetical protein ACJZ2D_009210 [Fusarium nematophilum]